MRIFKKYAMSFVFIGLSSIMMQAAQESKSGRSFSFTSAAGQRLQSVNVPSFCYFCFCLPC